MNLGRCRRCSTPYLLTLLVVLAAQTGLHATRHRTALHAVPTPTQSLRSSSMDGTMKGLQVNVSGGKAGNMRVVVVNDISGHLEVLGCLLHMLRGAGVQPTTLYTGPQQLLHALGFFQWLGYTPEETAPSLASSLLAERKGSFGYDVPGLGHFHNFHNRMVIPKGLSADLVICITPELARGECSAVISALKPSYLVTWVHRGDMVNSQVYSMYSRQALVALSPHVASACEQQTGVPVEWALPIAPHIDPVEECRNITCLKGFVMQGAIRGVSVRALGKGGHTRDYRTLWSRLLKLQRISKHATVSASQPRVHVTVLGRGDARHLEVPRQLSDYVTHMSGLPYPEFWSQIHHSLALLPCFGTEDYYTTRLSSTITASIITATPLIADRRLLNTYSFLSEEHVFLQKEGEDEAAAMVRITSMSEAEVFARRNALVKLRDTLNGRSQMVLSKWLTVAKALSTPDQTGRGGGFMLPQQTDPEVQAQRAARRVAFRAARRSTSGFQQHQEQQGTAEGQTMGQAETTLAQQQDQDRH